MGVGGGGGLKNTKNGQGVLLVGFPLKCSSRGTVELRVHLGSRLLQGEVEPGEGAEPGSNPTELMCGPSVLYIYIYICMYVC